jgi:hypothetical protein
MTTLETNPDLVAALAEQAAQEARSQELREQIEAARKITGPRVAELAEQTTASYHDVNECFAQVEAARGSGDAQAIAAAEEALTAARRENDRITKANLAEMHAIAMAGFDRVAAMFAQYDRARAADSAVMAVLTRARAEAAR